MSYNKEIHLPQQVETLFQLRAGGNAGEFEYVLSGIKKIMHDKEKFLDGLKQDEAARKKKIDSLILNTKTTVLKALGEKNTLDGLSSAKYVLSLLDGEHDAILMEFMDDVMTTCMSYNDGSGEEETVE